MANAYIAEFNGIGVQAGTGVQAPMEPAQTTQKVAFTTATQSSAFGAGAKLVAITCDADAHVVFGSNPTATASSYLLKANVEHVRAVAPGDKASFYDGSS